jgi:uncharacterized protein (DUF952 family)
MNWGQYLSRGVFPKQHEVIYHMCIRKDYEDQIQTAEGLYFPPTYQQDGFIHATADPQLLLSIGTHFYKADRNDWICLAIESKKLRSPVKYEPGTSSSFCLILIYLISCSCRFNSFPRFKLCKVISTHLWRNQC